MPYNDITKADAYFSSRFGYDDWEPLTNEQKNAILKSASQYLDSLCTWNGAKKGPNQEGAFPRTPDADPVPEPILYAELEIAYMMLKSGSGIPNASGSSQSSPLTELKAGSVTLKFDTGKTTSSTSCKGGCGTDFVNSFVKEYLSPYGLCSFGSTRLIPIERQ